MLKSGLVNKTGSKDVLLYTLFFLHNQVVANQMQMITFIIRLLPFIVILSCADHSLLYENDRNTDKAEKIQLNKVRVVSQSNDRMTVEFSYTYEHDIPAEQIKLYVLPDHGYWSMSAVSISEGTHSAQAVIGLNKSAMQADNVNESQTSILRFRFDHYLPTEFKGNIWGKDVEFSKSWQSNI